ncbi:MAG: hypothetical protein HY015_04780 [Bacteroidetes bacterium]|nr:hypothetical protein [Bacteroidota bacterium]MBI3482275.1 hypothetical protein [Bacteroidota bacterium]
MELLETQDPEKKKLIESSLRHKQEMEREVKDISDRSEKMLKNALIIGGALALTYVVVSQLSSSKTKKKKAKRSKNVSVEDDEEDETPSVFSQMGDKLVSTATVFLLDLAKEKLSDYLQNKKTKDENS